MSELGWGGGDGRPPKEKCPHCGKSFRGLKYHMAAKHQLPIEKRPKHVEDDDESFAMRAVQAEIDRACRIPNDDIDWLLP